MKLLAYIFFIKPAIAGSTAINGFINSTTNTAERSGLAQQNSPYAEYIIGQYINNLLNFLGVAFIVLIVYGGILIGWINKQPAGSDRMQAIAKAMGSLENPLHREVVKLYYSDEKITAHEIGDRLGLQTSTVTSTLTRVRTTLRERAIGYLAEEGYA